MKKSTAAEMQIGANSLPLTLTQNPRPFEPQISRLHSGEDYYCAKFQVISIRGTHPHTPKHLATYPHTHHDKAVTVLMLSYYVVGADNDILLNYNKLQCCSAYIKSCENELAFVRSSISRSIPDKTFGAQCKTSRNNFDISFL